MIWSKNAKASERWSLFHHDLVRWSDPIHTLERIKKWFVNLCWECSSQWKDGSLSKKLVAKLKRLLTFGMRTFHHLGEQMGSHLLSTFNSIWYMNTIQVLAVMMIVVLVMMIMIMMWFWRELWFERKLTSTGLSIHQTSAVCCIVSS